MKVSIALIHPMPFNAEKKADPESEVGEEAQIDSRPKKERTQEVKTETQGKSLVFNWQINFPKFKSAESWAIH